MSVNNAYKLLYLAYSAAPGRGSEWGLGWHYVAELARTQPVWLITHEDNRELIEPYLQTSHKNHPIHVTYVKLPGFLGWMRNSFYSLFNIHYYLWQFAAARAARRIHRAVKLDLVQHVSLFRWWMPSAGVALVDEGVGFIFGPVGGGDRMPRQFAKGVPFMARMSDVLRYIARNIWQRDPLLHRCIRKAHLLLAGVPSCEEWFRYYGGKNIVPLCSAMPGSREVTQAAIEARANKPKDKPFTFISCGGLSYYRGVDLAVRAFAKANLSGARYVHLCDGPMRQTIQQIANDLGIADRVSLPGDMPHIECIREVAKSDVCVHTVLRDSQGAVVEAMYAGLPVITLDHLTPAMIVTNECGTKIPIDDNTTAEQIVDRIAEVMKKYYNNPELVAQHGENAKAHAGTFSGDAKGKVYRECHEMVLAMLKKSSESAYNPPAANPVAPAKIS